MNKLKTKKGMIFSIDALLGISLLIIILLSSYYIFSTPETYEERNYERMNLISNDLLNSLAELKVYEAKNLSPTINELINSKSLDEDAQEVSTLNLVLTLWAQGEDENNETKKELAKNITRELINSIGSFTQNFNLSILISNSPIYGNASNIPSNKEVAVASIIESTYSSKKPKYGYVARAFLSNIDKEDASYIYFGGFVGQGNISVNFTLPSDANITKDYIEVFSGADFDLYLNGKLSGSFSPTTFSNFSANIKSSDINISNLKAGNNSLKIVFTSGNYTDHYLGGGFLKINYFTSKFYELGSESKKRYYFPGIEGLINLYDGFYIPGEINSMKAYLHYNNSISGAGIYLTIANATIYSSNATGEVKVSLSNSSITSALNNSSLSYANLSKKTIPIRMGMESLITQKVGNADVVLITDVSGSMSQCVENNSDCPPGEQRIDLAKELDKKFVNIILNTTGNRVALISFNSGISSYTSLSNDTSYLNSTIDSYSAGGGTCICCAENKAYEILQSESNISRQKFVIVMTDGIPSHKCANAGCEGTSTSGYFEGDCYGCTYCCNANPQTGAGCECPSSQNCGYVPWWWWFGCEYSCQQSCSCSCEIQNSNLSSCRLHNDLNATVYSIGFGPVANCQMGNLTLTEIASCGGGAYYGSQNTTELEQIYTNIANIIVSIAYTTQKVKIIGGNNLAGNILYPDSYLEFNYTSTPIEFGFGEFSLTLEKNFTSQGNLIFNKSKELEVIDAKVTSYSGDYWTSLLKINNSLGNFVAYNLSKYGDYDKLGDPYFINIPTGYIANNTNNITLKVGLSEENQTLGSKDSKLIYKIKIPGYVGYGDIFNTSDEAKQDAMNRLIDKIYNLTGINISNWNITKPTEALGGVTSIYSPSLVKVIIWKE